MSTRRLQRAIERELRQSVSNIEKSKVETEVRGNVRLEREARYRREKKKKITQASVCRIVTIGGVKLWRSQDVTL